MTRHSEPMDRELVPCVSQVKLSNTPMVCIADHRRFPGHYYVAADRVRESESTTILKEVISGLCILAIIITAIALFAGYFLNMELPA